MSGLVSPAGERPTPAGKRPTPALVGLCRALLGSTEEAAEQLAGDVLGYVQSLPGGVEAAVRAGASLIDLGSLLGAGRRLRNLPPERAASYLAALGRSSPGAPALEGLKALILLVAGAGMAERLLHAGERPTPVRPDAALVCIPSNEWPAGSRADVVVIGSGAGGAMAARTFAAQGASVLVVEEGERHLVEEFAEGHPLERWRSLYRDGGATAAIGFPPVVLPIGRGVGGTTLVNSGTCYRPPGRVVERWRRAGLEVAEPGRFSELAGEVERILQVAPVPDEIMGRNGELALQGARLLGWRAKPLVRNAPGCGGCCQCAIGCPRNAKYGVHLSVLPEACAKGATILTSARVERILHQNGRCEGVEVRCPDGRHFSVHAPTVVVGAGATETPPLLRRSGLGAHPRTGRNLALHPALAVAGRFADPVLAWRGVLQSAAIEQFHDSDGVLIEATATPPGMGSMALPGYGGELAMRIAGAEHLATLGAMVADLPSGRVWGSKRAVVTYRLARRDARRLLRALVACGEVLFAAGAEEVLTGLREVPVVSDPASLREAADRATPGQMHLAAFHPTGTCAAGADPQLYPVDPRGRLRGVQGVWVCDASVLPACPEVNPQVSIMAVSLGISEGAVELVD